MILSKNKTKKSHGDLKLQVAKEILKYINSEKIIGVGTGSTVKFLIDELKKIKSRIEFTIPSSIETKEKLIDNGFKVVDLNYVDKIDLYVDSADEVTIDRTLIKGGGGALTQEKICRVSSKKFICIVDESKIVENLGKFPLPVEIIPSSRSYVTKEIIKLGGFPQYREKVITDNGNIILDVHGLNLKKSEEMEKKIDNIVGVVCNGLFSVNKPEIILVARSDGTIQVIE